MTTKDELSGGVDNPSTSELDETTQQLVDGKLRVAVLTNLLAPYRVPLFNSIGGRSGIDLTVFCTTDSQKNRSWETECGEKAFTYSVLSGHSMHSYVLDRSVGINLSIVSALRECRPDIVVVGGYSDLTMWIALAYSKLTRTPLVVWLGSWRESARVSNFISDSIKRGFVQQANTWITYGSQAAEWISELGGNPDSTYEATNTVDTEWFHGRAMETGTPPSGESPLHLLYCGQLISRKNVGKVIRAIRDFSSDRIRFTVVGDGPRREDLEQLASEVSPDVTFEGYVERTELPSYYGSADALVLPSNREVWGLVVNEALSCGAAAVVSSQCGCATDLVEPGFNGATFDSEDETELRSVLEQLIDERQALRGRRDKIARDVMRRASIEQSADAFVSAVREAYKQTKPS